MSLSFDDIVYERKIRKYRRGVAEEDVDAQLAAFQSFCENEVWIAHPKGRRKLVLREAQLETARHYISDDRVLILKARQIGFTTLTMAFMLWRALTVRDHSAINLSRKQDDAEAALRMASFAYDQMDPKLTERLAKRTDRNVQRITFDNGSYIESHPSANNPARSRTVTLMTMDEFAFMPDPEDAWAAVKPTFDIGGRVIILSTANGMGNMFFDMWERAYVAEASEFVPIFFPWWAVPDRDEEWYERQKLDFQDWQLHQEFPATPEEAFIKSGNPVFNVDVIRGYIPSAPKKIRLEAANPDGWRGVTPIQDSTSPLNIYEWPQPYRSYVLGADVAMGLEHGDFSAAHVIRVDTGVVVAVWHGSIDPDLYGLEVARLAGYYNLALAGVEVNNHGLTTIKALQRASYPRIFQRTLQTNRIEKSTQELGFYTSHVTKPRIIDELGGAMRDGSLTIYDKGTLQELVRYVRLPDGKTAGSPHDDRVMSLAIAWAMVPHAYDPDQPQAQEALEGTFAWALEQVMPKPAVGTPIGTHNVRPRT